MSMASTTKAVSPGTCDTVTRSCHSHWLVATWKVGQILGTKESLSLMAEF